MSKEIEAIKARRAAISPAPWQHMPPADNEERRGVLRQYVTRTVGCGDVPPEKFFIAILHWPEKPERDIADADFIANAPTDIDYLTDEIDRLTERLTDLESRWDLNLSQTIAAVESNIELHAQLADALILIEALRKWRYMEVNTNRLQTSQNLYRAYDIWEDNYHGLLNS